MIYMYDNSSGARTNRSDISLCITMYAVTLQECNHCFHLTHITSAQLARLALRKRVGKKKKA